MKPFQINGKHLSQIPALQLLIGLGFDFLTPAEALIERQNRTSNVLLESILRNQLKEINRIRYKGGEYLFSEENVQSAIQKLKNIKYDGLLKTNEAIYDLITLGTALAETINRHVDGIKANAESSAASIENIRNLSNGDVDWAISQNEVALLAYHGEGKYKERPVTSLQSVFGTLLSYVQIFTAADSSISNVADFKGKRIGVGAPGSGGERVAQKILGYYGLDYKKIKPEFMSNPEMVTALKDGTLDAFVITHPLKSAALLDLTTTFKAKMISIGDEDFYKKFPYYSKTEVPAGTYKNIDQAGFTPTSRIIMYTSTKSKLTEDQVYRITKGIWENAEEWVNTHPAVKKYTLLEDAVKGINIPLHPGAAKYYMEKGLGIPSNLLNR
ncbi:TAXI family TRAP transporter solute-binding subunit [Desulfobacula sp.]|uniref:TAXI family TRAP transporter solute-binding subunit n=1 Tax=Desulfobacula sp. TaxID=2593537 RepID=UPI0026140477|nr:TAXI family TRAP transporter solute-binding subunit [Desulfobacula sp.]